MADPATIEEFSQKFSFIPKETTRSFIIEKIYFCKCDLTQIENELQKLNRIYQFSTLSTIDEEPRRLDQCRNEEILDNILNTFPKDICRIVTQYGIMTSKEIGERIYSDVSDDLPFAHLYMRQTSCDAAYVGFNLMYNFDDELAACVRLTMNSADIFVVSRRMILTVDFDEGDIKNQAIRAGFRVANGSSGVTSFITRIILMWRSYTM